MTAKSNYLENKVIDHILRNTAYSTPGTSIYIALYTTDPGEADGGTEVSGGSYARVQCTGWDAPSNGATQNTAAITFPTATANWGTVTHVGIRDASSAGNLLYYGALAVSKTVNDGDIFEFLAGALDVSET